MKRATLWHKWTVSSARPGRAVGLSWIVVVAALPLLVAGPSMVAASANGSSGPEAAEPADLANLAEAGQFDRLLQRLEQDYASTDDSSVRTLIEDLQRYRDHRAAAAAERDRAHVEALDKARKAFEADRLEAALTAAIEAHGLALDPAALLAEPVVAEVVAQAERRAAAAREQGQWVEVLDLYRRLDMLFKDQGKYHDELDEASRHVRVLRIYAPKVLRELHEARAEARERAEVDDVEAGEGPGEHRVPEIEVEPWQSQVDDVGVSVLRRALQQAARLHITNEGYTSMMRGAVEAVLVLLRTDALADPFPSFEDRQKRDEFIDQLERIRAQLAADAGQDNGDASDRIGWLRAATMIDRVLTLNERTVNLPERVLVHEMAEGATGMLDDFSGVIWPRQIPSLERTTRGEFSGVGIQISRRDSRLVVVSPLLSTPAQEAGIRAGDIIAKVDGQDTSAWSLDRAVDEITGDEGSKVTLSIERGGEPELIDFTLTRARIRIESVRGWEHTPDGGWDYFIDRDHGIGYVRLTQFIRQTPDDLDAAVAALQGNGAINGLILDLRFNPGGLLPAAIEVADRFIDEGALVSTVNADGDRLDEHRARRHRTYPPFPVVVLLNEGSASASEIVAGALQDHGRAVVVGTRSFGKGSVQDLFRLDPQAFLKLTTQHYKLPHGRIIDRKPHADTWGIEPDLNIEMTERQMLDAAEFRQKVDVLRDADDAERVAAREILERGLDPQLEAGLLVLKTRHTARQIANAEATEFAGGQRAARRDD